MNFKSGINNGNIVIAEFFCRQIKDAVTQCMSQCCETNDWYLLIPLHHLMHEADPMTLGDKFYRAGWWGVTDMMSCIERFQGTNSGSKM